MIDTHNMVVDFGRHFGERYTRVLISYLRWMVNEPHPKAEIAMAELDRRGVPLVQDPVEISGHAVDSASMRVWKIWRKTRKSPKIGLHAWLIDTVVDALATGEPSEDGRISYNGMILVLTRGELWWTLKTIMKDLSK